MHGESCIYQEKFVNLSSSYSAIKLALRLQIIPQVNKEVPTISKSTFSLFENYSSLNESSLRNSTAVSIRFFQKKMMGRLVTIQQLQLLLTAKGTKIKLRSWYNMCSKLFEQFENFHFKPYKEIQTELRKKWLQKISTKNCIPSS